MTRTFSRFSLAILRAGALICMVLLLSGLGLAQKAVTARATIPFNCWAEGYEFQAGDYLFDNAVPGSASIHRGGNHGCFFRISTHSVWMLSGAGIPARVVTEPYDSLNFASTVLSLTGSEATSAGPRGHVNRKRQWLRRACRRKEVCSATERRAE